jgi:hypothetical protein
MKSFSYLWEVNTAKQFINLCKIHNNFLYLEFSKWTVNTTKLMDKNNNYKFL